MITPKPFQKGIGLCVTIDATGLTWIELTAKYRGICVMFLFLCINTLTKATY